MRPGEGPWAEVGGWIDRSPALAHFLREVERAGGWDHKERTSIHPLTQPIFTEQLQCARHCTRTDGVTAVMELIVKRNRQTVMSESIYMQSYGSGQCQEEKVHSSGRVYNRSIWLTVRDRRSED